MSTLTINDLTVSRNLNSSAMSTVTGGYTPIPGCCYPRRPRFPFPIPRPFPFPCGFPRIPRIPRIPVLRSI